MGPVLLHSRTRILATFDQGGAIFWDDYDSEHIASFATELTNPLATFTPRGWLAVVGSGEYLVYATHERQITARAGGIVVGQEPIAIVATDHADQFAIADVAGNVVVMQMPRD